MPDEYATPSPARSSRRDDSASTTFQLILFVACVRRLDDTLDLTLKRIQEHNRIVTATVDGESAEPKPELVKYVKYVGDGALISFGEHQAASALRCAARIMEGLKHVTNPPGSEEIRSRMGLSAGNVDHVRYQTVVDDRAPVPCDDLGPPIEIATRLVSDIAKPGQIVLDEAAWKTVGEADLKALKVDWPPAALLPKGGEELSIQGVPDSIPVFELVWLNGSEKPLIQNRRLLADELIDLLHGLIALRFSLQEAPAEFDDRKEARRFAKFVEGLEQQIGPDHSEIRALNEIWERTREVSKLDDIREGVSAVLAAFQRLARAWHDNKDAIYQRTHELESAGGACYEAHANLENQAKFLYDAIINAEKRIGDTF